MSLHRNTDNIFDDPFGAMRVKRVTDNDDSRNADTGLWGVESPEVSTFGDTISFRLSKNEPKQTAWLVTGFCALPIGLVVISNLVQGTAIDWLEIAVYAGSLALVGGIFWFVVLKVRMDRDARIIVSKTHLHLPKKQKSPIPWSNVRALEIHRGSGKYGRHQRILAVMTKHDDRAQVPKRSWLERMYVNWYGTLLTEELDRLEGEPQDVYGAISRMAPPDVLAASSIQFQVQEESVPDDAEF